MTDLVEFLGAMFGTRPIELVAAFCGLANVALIIRRSLWNYPFGFATVTLYPVVFFDYRLYSDALLQVYFFGIQILGVVWWLSGRNAAGDLVVRRLSGGQTLLTGAAAAAGALGLGLAMARFTDAALPFWYAAIAALSITAQTLMARRYLSSWLFWIAVDVLAIGVFISRGLVPTAALYAVFLGLACLGWRQWHKAHAMQMT